MDGGGLMKGKTLWTADAESAFENVLQSPELRANLAPIRAGMKKAFAAGVEFGKSLSAPAEDRKQVVHHLKAWPGVIDQIDRGEKTFDLRKNDRDFRVGDLLELREWDPKVQEYRGLCICRGVSYVLQSDGPFAGLEEGYCILGLSDRVTLWGNESKEDGSK